jgi:hypothetical protein
MGKICVCDSRDPIARADEVCGKRNSRTPLSRSIGHDFPIPATPEARMNETLQSAIAVAALVISVVALAVTLI